MNTSNPPQAKQIPHIIKIHEQEIVDQYDWLRDKDWPNVQNQEIIRYLEAENLYSSNFFDAHKDKKNMLFEELKSRIKLDDVSAYTKKDNYYYYSKTESDKEYPIFCRKKDSVSGAEEVILDVNDLAQGKTFTKISALAVSPSQNLLAYSVDHEGNEKYTIYIKDLQSGNLLEDTIDSTIGALVWHQDESGFFYTPVNAQWRHDKIKYHKIGANILSDLLIMHEKDPVNQLSIYKSSSKEYFFITSSGHDSSEIYYFGMGDKSFTPIKLLTRKEKIFYTVDHSGRYFYVHTNDNGPNFRLATISIDNIKEDAMEDFIPHNSESYMSSFSVTKNYIIINRKNKALPEISVVKIDASETKNILFPDAAFMASGYSTNFEDDDIRVNYSSLKRPDIVYNYHYEEEKLNILKKQEIPSGFNADEYEVQRLWADSEGVRVPITIFYKKALLKKDGSNPLYLYGYGSYGISMPVSFRNVAVSLADRGFIYAIAHIRGGDDLGHAWYEDAKFLNKKNSFKDFLSSAHYLIDNSFTSSGNIVIAGGSAGGMLVGYAANEAPELFRGIIAHVPFVDVLNTMLDETLPLTPGEFKEWGNPQSKEYFEYIKSYSPYDNVGHKQYPSMLITAGISDPRVTYWEAAKWTAKLRAHNLSNNPIYLKVNMTAGHQGASGRLDYLKEVAEEMIFIFSIFDIPNA